MRAAVVVTTLLILLVSGCAKPMTNSSSPASQPYQGPTVTLPDGFSVRLELATDDPTRAQGLMYRDRIPEGTGMLFMFAREGDYPFWMKNTLVPLDMIWLDASHRVVHVTPDVPPCKADPCPSYPPGAASNYVLELGAGQAAKHRVANGATLKFERIGDVVIR